MRLGQRIRGIFLVMLWICASLILFATSSSTFALVTPWQPLTLQSIYPIAAELFTNANSPTLGNAKGNTTVIEFLDYQCPHCKEMAPVMDQLIKSNKNLRVVIKETAIMDGSELPAKAALAAQQQNKFSTLHKNFLNSTQALTADAVFAIAKRAGINIDKLRADMEANNIERELSDNIYLAHQLDLAGTPSFVIAKVTIDPKTQQIISINEPILIQGGMDLKSFKAAVQYVQSNQ